MIEFYKTVDVDVTIDSSDILDFFSDLNDEEFRQLLDRIYENRKGNGIVINSIHLYDVFLQEHFVEAAKKYTLNEIREKLPI